jgi:regulator of RNase E activity RraB
MPLSILIVLGLFGLYLLLRGAQRGSGGSDPDADTLEELLRAGSDLNRPHEIEFFLYLEHETEAEAIALQLRGEGFGAEVRPTETEDCWLCLATRTMRPELATLHQLRERFTILAETSGGAYDGWGTTVVEAEHPS